MSIVLLVVTDGRGDYLTRTLTSFDEQVSGPVTRRIIHDDSGDPAYTAWLAVTYPGYELVSTPGRSGFGGAMQSAWQHVAALDSGERWVFGLEDDFVFTRPVDLAELAAVLDEPAQRHLVQLALRRQPWNAAERAAGGVVESNPGAYTETVDWRGCRWLEHRLFFTTNPSLYRRDLCHMGWPNVPRSEGEFTHYLLREGVPGMAGVPAADVRFGFWGARDSGEWVRHIGDVRAGVGY